MIQRRLSQPFRRNLSCYRKDFWRRSQNDWMVSPAFVIVAGGNNHHHLYKPKNGNSQQLSFFGSQSSNKGNNNNNNNNNNNKFNFGKRIKMPSNTTIGAASSMALVSLTKGKSILAALKLTKFASLGSMLLTVGAYTSIYGFPYAAGMVGLILVHESGHALAMRHFHVPFSPMIFVPFLGAAVGMKRPPKNAYEEALIALAGPVMGTAGSMAIWGTGMVTQSQLCFALADFGFMINLFNLIPIGMLDGGRIGNALSPYAGVAGVGLASTMILSGAIHNPIFYLITLAGGYQSGMRLYNLHYKGIPHHDPSLPPYYYNLTKSQKMTVGAGYFGLLSVLFGSMAMNEHLKKSPRRLQYEQQINNNNDGSIAGFNNIYRDY